MRRILCLWACLFLLALPARAVTVIDGGDMSARIDAAQSAARSMQVGSYGMTPIPGTLVADGKYPVTVASSSPYFRITEAVLTVSGGEMSADITIGSTSYDRVRMDGEIAGTVQDGRTTFHIPVPALNMPFACAAHSVKRDRWYDRTLLVDAASLPKGALGFELPDYAVLDKVLNAYETGGTATKAPVAEVEPVAVNHPDGEYAIEVTLTGGSGRASVSSPTRMIVRDGRAWARLLWSSAYYDYMLLDGVRYDNLSTDGGNSTFEIPIPAMDAPVEVIADTTAMGDPVEIRYQLTFYGESVGDVRQVPQEAAKYVLLISLGIIVVGGVLNYFVKRGRK